MPTHSGVDNDRGRLPNMVERYAALPNTTRLMLESLQDEDIANIKALAILMREKKGIGPIRHGVEMAERFTALGRVTKWAVGGLIAIAVGTASLMTAVRNIMEFFHLGGPR